MDPRIDKNAIGSGISVIFPVYNEALIIQDTIRNYFGELDGKVPFEIIVAEDGSTDDTKIVLQRLGRDLPIRIYTSENKKGYLLAIKDSLKLAKLDWIFLVDSDYQFAAIDFWRLVPKMSDHDVILGKKSPRKDPYYRIILSRGLNLLLRWLFNIPFWDMDTGFRLFRKEPGEVIAPRVCHFAFFTAEFVVRCFHAGYRICEVPVPHYSRKIGSSNIFFISRIPKIIWKQFRGILSLHKELSKIQTEVK
jgi:dolichol-phosphate mannosyltransferase